MPTPLIVFLRALRRRAAPIVLAALVATGPARADVSLTPHSAVYHVKIRIVSGRLDTELRWTGDRYVATHTIRPTGLSRMLAHGFIQESSEFFESGDGIRPDRYRSIDTISHDAENVDIRFDWSAGEAHGTVNDVPVSSSMDRVAHDRISIQYELMHDLLKYGKPDGEYVLFDIDRLKKLHVTMIGRRTLQVPAGTFEAVGIRHQTENSKRVTTLWCVEELGYLPVVIEQHRLGKLRVRAELEEYRQAPAAAAVNSR